MQINEKEKIERKVGQTRYFVRAGFDKEGLVGYL